MGKLKPPPGRASCQDGFRYADPPSFAWRDALVPRHSAALFAVPSGRDGRGRKHKEGDQPCLTPRPTEGTTSKAPSHIAYQVRDREGQKGFWTRIGSVWPHADGKGFNIQLEGVPLDGRITLRVATEKKD